MRGASQCLVFCCLGLLLAAAATASIDAVWNVGLRASSDALGRCYGVEWAICGTLVGATDGPPPDASPIDKKYDYGITPTAAEVDCADFGDTGRWQVDQRAPLDGGEKVWHLLVYAGHQFPATYGCIYVTMWNPSGQADASPDDGLRIDLYSVSQFGGARTLLASLDLDRNGYFTPLNGISGDYCQITLPFAAGTAGDELHPHRLELVASCGAGDAPSVVDDGAYTSGTGSLQATWSATDAGSVLEYQYAIGTSSTDLLVDWTPTGVAAQATASGLSLETDATYYWYVRARRSDGWGAVGRSDGIIAAESCPIGAARASLDGRAVCWSGAVVTSTCSDAAGLWVESSDRASAAKVDASWPCSRGDVLDVAGVLSWADGVPVLASPELKRQIAGETIAAVAGPARSLANDRDECLSYAGLSPVGLLVTLAGRVTDQDAGAFYVDDGSALMDGLGSADGQFTGIRIAYGQQVTPPPAGSCVRVTGIRTVQKAVLPHDAYVNGRLRTAGESVFVPVIHVRDQGDLRTLPAQ